MLILQGVDADPHVLPVLQLSAGCGSSQTYLLFALPSVLPNIMAAVTSATLNERISILMVQYLTGFVDSHFSIEASAGRSYFSLFPLGQTIMLFSFHGFILRSHCGSPSLLTVSWVAG